MAETTAKLAKNIYSLEVKNHELVKLAYDTYLANSRSAKAKTLKRGEVRGGGKKPWRQKGTGRARFGSTRNPIWRHGGIAFGPTGQENYTKTLSRSAKKVAICQALSMQHKVKLVQIVPDFAPKDGRVKETLSFLNTNKISATSNVLLVVPEKTDIILRATRNISYLKVVRPTYLNVFDILNANKILITTKSLPLIEDWLAKEDK